jgi:hypothetical protein
MSPIKTPPVVRARIANACAPESSKPVSRTHNDLPEKTGEYMIAADMFTQVSRGMDRWLRFAETHRQAAT